MLQKTTNHILQDGLLEAEQRAIELHFKGKTSTQIGQELNLNPVTIRRWFAMGGKLDIPYKRFAAEQLELRRRIVADKWARTLNSANEELGRLAVEAKSENVRLAAIKELNDRAIGKSIPMPTPQEPNEKQWNFIEDMKRSLGIDEASLKAARTEQDNSALV